jgi:ABC-type Fe3+/spermidine/putrescine transport system ATPase subunit
MRAGRIVQVGTPDQVWAGPADEDTARFLGLNVLDGRAIRPEAVGVRPLVHGEAGEGVVTQVVRQGPTVRLAIALDAGGTLQAVVAALDHPNRGDRVGVVIDESGVTALP